MITQLSVLPLVLKSYSRLQAAFHETFARLGFRPKTSS